MAINDLLNWAQSAPSKKKKTLSQRKNCLKEEERSQKKSLTIRRPSRLLGRASPQASKNPDSRGLLPSCQASSPS